MARKPHGCQICLGMIGRGDTYLRQRNVEDDGPYVFKAHALCWSLSLHLAREAGMFTDDGEWPEPSEVRDALVLWFTWLPHSDSCPRGEHVHRDGTRWPTGDSCGGDASGRRPSDA